MDRVSRSVRNDVSCLVTLVADMRGGMIPCIPMASGPMSGHQFDRHCTETPLLEVFRLMMTAIELLSGCAEFRAALTVFSNGIRTG